MTLAPPIFNPPGPTAVIPQSSAIFLTPSAGSPAGTEIFYTVNGPFPTPQTLYAGPISLLEGGNVAAIETAPGYLDSPVASVDYLPGPTACDSPPPTFDRSPGPLYVPSALGVIESPPAIVCYTKSAGTAPVAPTCNLQAECTGSASTYSDSRISVLPADADPLTGLVTVSATGCLPGCGAIGQVSETFVFTLVPPFLTSANPAGEGLPGSSNGDAGIPVANTSMTIPADAGLPYGPFVGQPVAQQLGLYPLPLADFLCWSKAAPATCACASPLPLTTAAPSVTLPAAADVNPGDTLSVIACDGSPPMNASGYYAPSAVTTVQF
jgi:hypothetical protein